MKNTNQTLTCPKCGEEIALEQALAHRVQDMVSEQTVAIIDAKKAEVANIKEQYHAQLQEQLRTKEDIHAYEIAALNEKNGILEGRLQETNDQIEQEVTKRMAIERQVLSDQLDLQIREENRLQLVDKDNAIADLKTDLRRIESEHRLQVADKDGIISTLKADVERLHQRIEQGSIQRQGESLEVVFESELRQAFPGDVVEPVAKGKPGADNLHHVRTTAGAQCGIILWENKRAKDWSNEWLDKLKRDQRNVKVDRSAIVCTPSCTPKGLHGFGYYHGVLVCEHAYAISLAALLRAQLASEAQVRAQQSNGCEEKDQLHAFVCSDFHQQATVIIESTIAQLDQLAKDKVSTENKWKARERQINATIAAVAKLYGGIQSIVGIGTLPNLPTLALELQTNPKLL